MNNAFYKSLSKAKRVALVGDLTCLQNLCADLTEQGKRMPELLAFTDAVELTDWQRGIYKGKTADVTDYLFRQPVDVVLVTMYGLPKSQAARLAKYCQDSATSFFAIPAYVGEICPDAQVVSCGKNIALTPRSLSFDSFSSRVLKRLVDFVASLTLLLTIFPVIYVIVLLCMKRSGVGSLLVHEPRAGRNGKTFNSWQFRTIRMADGEPTTIGSMLQRTHLENLPQLINVFFGSMSLVGPQLHQLLLDDWDASAVACFMKRHRVKPGMTGWARTHRIECQTLEQCRAAEQYYVCHWTFWTDIKVLWRTILVLMLH